MQGLRVAHRHLAKDSLLCQHCQKLHTCTVTILREVLFPASIIVLPSYLYNKPHCFKAVRLYPVAASRLGNQDGHQWAPHVLEAHHIAILTLLLQIHLQHVAWSSISGMTSASRAIQHIPRKCRHHPACCVDACKQLHNQPCICKHLLTHQQGTARKLAF